MGRVGVEPTTPEGNGFTVRRVCRFATCPLVHGAGVEPAAPEGPVSETGVYSSSTTRACFGVPSETRTRMSPVRATGTSTLRVYQFYVLHDGAPSRVRTEGLPVKGRLLFRLS